MPVYGGSCGHDRRHQMRPPAFALPSLEIAIAGGSAAFSGSQLIWIHAQTHAASGIAPFHSSAGKDLVQAFFFCLLFDLAAARDNHRRYVAMDLLSLKVLGGRPQVFNASIRA